MPIYENPAKLFLKKNSIKSVDDVIAYANFLRSTSGVSSEPPVSLDEIFKQYGLEDPEFVPLPQQQGMILPLETPKIIIHSGDKVARQRYSIAHELVELLFLELLDTKSDNKRNANPFNHDEKERICQKAAAHLLMPSESFEVKSTKLGLSFNTAIVLASEYEVSLTAALCRITDIYKGQAAVILWQMMNKPTELEKKVSDDQIGLPGFSQKPQYPKKLRVAWHYGDFRKTFIPRYKSIDSSSSVYRAWENSQITSGDEMLPFGRYNRTAIIESKSINVEGEIFVLTLVR